MKCQVCGSETSNQKEFCSRKCRNTELGKKILIETRGYPDGYHCAEEYQMASERKRLFEKECIICGNEFKGTRKDECCSKKCIEKNRVRKIAKTTLERHGHIGFQDPKLQDKINEIIQQDDVKDKRRKTCLEKYGNTNVLNSKYVCEIRDASNLERYGVTNPFRSNEVMRGLWLDSLGVENPQKDPSINQRTYETRKERYELMGAIPKEASEKTCLEKYGHKTYFGSLAARNNKVMYGKASKTSLRRFIPLYKWLRKRGFNRDDILLGVDGSHEFRGYSVEHNKTFCYDFTILSEKLIIEFNGSAFHARDLDSRVAFTTAEASLLHDQQKIQFITDLGYKVLVIWDDEDIEESLDRCQSFIQESVNGTNV